MCKESVQLEILKRSEIPPPPPPPKKAPARSPFIEIGQRNILFLYLALHVLGQLQIYQTKPFEALFMHRNVWLYYK